MRGGKWPPTSTSTVTVQGGITSRTEALRLRSTPECGSRNSRSLGRSTPSAGKGLGGFRRPHRPAFPVRQTAETGSPGGSCRADQGKPAVLVQIRDPQAVRPPWPSIPPPAPPPDRSVLAETDPATLAPNASARALASARVIFSSVPVKTTVLPATGLSTGRARRHRLHRQAAPPSASIAARSAGFWNAADQRCGQHLAHPVNRSQLGPFRRCPVCAWVIAASNAAQVP